MAHTSSPFLTTRTSRGEGVLEVFGVSVCVFVGGQQSSPPCIAPATPTLTLTVAQLPPSPPSPQVWARQTAPDQVHHPLPPQPAVPGLHHLLLAIANQQ
jgi:hypothetical protein